MSARITEMMDLREEMRHVMFCADAAIRNAKALIGRDLEPSMIQELDRAATEFSQVVTQLTERVK